MGITGLSGVVFGGSKHDILFVTVAGIILDLYSGNPMEVNGNGSSLYKVTGLVGASETKSTSLEILESSCVKIP